MVHLYAEHLLNIRTLSVQVSLSTPSDERTNATLSADGSVLTVTHEDESARIKLPVNLSQKQSAATLKIPALPSKNLNFRFQLENKDDHSNGNGQQEGGNIVPWTADTLTPETEIRCRYCLSSLVGHGKITTWKDLPSEGWAEMMEFWHCHKPHEPHDHERGNEAGAKKGYAAGGKLALEAGVGLVDTQDFLLAPEDCTNLRAQQFLSGARDQTKSLRCTGCSGVIGYIDHMTGGYRIRKPHVSLSSYPGRPAATYDERKWLACFLLSAMDNKGVRKFDVRGSGKVLKLWIFTPNLTVSSSAGQHAEPIRVAKVLWRWAAASEDNLPAQLTTASLAEDDLRLPNGEAMILEAALKEGAELLPKASRSFQDWNVGLLQRFTTTDMVPPHG